MKKERKPLSTKKPPVQSDDRLVIDDWAANKTMPSVQPLIAEIDELIHKVIPQPMYAVKWGSAYYGTQENGWLIEVAAYLVSVNVVFVKGASFHPQPPLGEGEDSRYFKLTSIEQVKEFKIENFIRQALELPGWK